MLDQWRCWNSVEVWVPDGPALPVWKVVACSLPGLDLVPSSGFRVLPRSLYAAVILSCIWLIIQASHEPDDLGRSVVREEQQMDSGCRSTISTTVVRRFWRMQAKSECYGAEADGDEETCRVEIR